MFFYVIKLKVLGYYTFSMDLVLGQSMKIFTFIWNCLVVWHDSSEKAKMLMMKTEK